MAGFSLGSLATKTIADGLMSKSPEPPKGGIGDSTPVKPHTEIRFVRAEVEYFPACLVAGVNGACCNRPYQIEFVWGSMYESQCLTYSEEYNLPVV